MSGNIGLRPRAGARAGSGNPGTNGTILNSYQSSRSAHAPVAPPPRGTQSSRFTRELRSAVEGSRPTVLQRPNSAGNQSSQHAYRDDEVRELAPNWGNSQGSSAQSYYGGSEKKNNRSKVHEPPQDNVHPVGTPFQPQTNYGSQTRITRLVEQLPNSAEWPVESFSMASPKNSPRGSREDDLSSWEFQPCNPGTAGQDDGGCQSNVSRPVISDPIEAMRKAMAETGAHLKDELRQILVAEFSKASRFTEIELDLSPVLDAIQHMRRDVLSENSGSHSSSQDVALQEFRSSIQDVLGVLRGLETQTNQQIASLRESLASIMETMNRPQAKCTEEPELDVEVDTKLERNGGEFDSNQNLDLDKLLEPIREIAGDVRGLAKGPDFTPVLQAVRAIGCDIHVLADEGAKMNLNPIVEAIADLRSHLSSVSTERRTNGQGAAELKESRIGIPGLPVGATTDNQEVNANLPTPTREANQTYAEGVGLAKQGGDHSHADAIHNKRSRGNIADILLEIQQLRPLVDCKSSLITLCAGRPAADVVRIMEEVQKVTSATDFAAMSRSITDVRALETFAESPTVAPAEVAADLSKRVAPAEKLDIGFDALASILEALDLQSKKVLDEMQDMRVEFVRAHPKILPDDSAGSMKDGSADLKTNLDETSMGGNTDPEALLREMGSAAERLGEAGDSKAILHEVRELRAGLQVKDNKCEEDGSNANKILEEVREMRMELKKELGTDSCLNTILGEVKETRMELGVDFTALLEVFRLGGVQKICSGEVGVGTEETRAENSCIALSGPENSSADLEAVSLKEIRAADAPSNDDECKELKQLLSKTEAEKVHALQDTILLRQAMIRWESSASEFEHECVARYNKTETLEQQCAELGTAKQSMQESVEQVRMNCADTVAKCQWDTQAQLETLRSRRESDVAELTSELSEQRQRETNAAEAAAIAEAKLRDSESQVQECEQKTHVAYQRLASVQEEFDQREAELREELDAANMELKNKKESEQAQKEKSDSSLVQGNANLVLATSNTSSGQLATVTFDQVVKVNKRFGTQLERAGHVAIYKKAWSGDPLGTLRKILDQKFEIMIPTFEAQNDALSSVKVEPDGNQLKDDDPTSTVKLGPEATETDGARPEDDGPASTVKLECEATTPQATVGTENPTNTVKLEPVASMPLDAIGTETDGKRPQDDCPSSTVQLESEAPLPQDAVGTATGGKLPQDDDPESSDAVGTENPTSTVKLETEAIMPQDAIGTATGGNRLQDYGPASTVKLESDSSNKLEFEATETCENRYQDDGPASTVETTMTQGPDIRSEPETTMTQGAVGTDTDGKRPQDNAVKLEPEATMFQGTVATDTGEKQLHDNGPTSNASLCYQDDGAESNDISIMVQQTMIKLEPEATMPQDAVGIDTEGKPPQDDGLPIPQDAAGDTADPADDQHHEPVAAEEDGSPKPTSDSDWNGLGDLFGDGETNDAKGAEGRQPSNRDAPACSDILPNDVARPLICGS